MDKPISEIVSLIEEVLALEPGVRAIFLNGSHVVGTAAAGSDVDFTVLVDDEDSSDRAVQSLGRKFQSKGRCHEVPQFLFYEIDVSVCVLLKTDVDSWVERVFSSVETLLELQKVLQHKIVEAAVVHDPEDLLPEYQKHLTDYPDSLADEVAAFALDYLSSEYPANDSFRSIYHFCYSRQDILEYICIALYARNKRFYMPPLKRLSVDLPVLQPNIQVDLDQIIEKLRKD